MENSRPVANPYEVLGVPQAASKAEIVAAMASAMKAKRYPVKVIAEAQKVLLDPEKRLLADFLRPFLPVPQRFNPGDFSELDAPAPELGFLEAFDGLDAALEQAARLEQMERETTGA